jgi:hypothetical protein
MRVFGCLTYVHIEKNQDGKMGSKFAKCIFVGYNDILKAYHCYNLEIRKVVVSNNIIFNKNIMGTKFLHQE